MSVNTLFLLSLVMYMFESFRDWQSSKIRWKRK